MMVFFLLIFSFHWSLSAREDELPPVVKKEDRIFTADQRKANIYFEEGIVQGGDSYVKPVLIDLPKFEKIKANPETQQPQLERVTIPIRGNYRGGGSPIARPPYFHFSYNSILNRVELTIFGNPRLTFAPSKVLDLFTESVTIERFLLFPVLEEDRWSFVLELQKASAHGIEVFENPQSSSIIIDFRVKKSEDFEKNKSKPKTSESPEKTHET